jgi:hypothetical protein
MRFIKEDMRGHIRMWAQLAKKHGSPTSEHPVSHEVWQYMGTFDDATHGSVHQFRHRDLMVDGVEKGRFVENIPVEAGDFDHLNPFEYITKMIPWETVAVLTYADEMNRNGWEKVFADRQGHGVFTVYRRERQVSKLQGAVL